MFCKKYMYVLVLKSARDYNNIFLFTFFFYRNTSLFFKSHIVTYYYFSIKLFNFFPITSLIIFFFFVKNLKLQIQNNILIYYYTQLWNTTFYFFIFNYFSFSYRKFLYTFLGLHNIIVNFSLKWINYTSN